jgi:hypothetical protein
MDMQVDGVHRLGRRFAVNGWQLAVLGLSGTGPLPERGTNGSRLRQGLRATDSTGRMGLMGCSSGQRKASCEKTIRSLPNERSFGVVNRSGPRSGGLQCQRLPLWFEAGCRKTG